MCGVFFDRHDGKGTPTTRRLFIRTIGAAGEGESSSFTTISAGLEHARGRHKRAEILTRRAVASARRSLAQLLLLSTLPRLPPFLMHRASWTKPNGFTAAL
jgi:hypothetical protein